jgi:hypothetical protein
LHPLIQLGAHADASPEHHELQIEERLKRGYREGNPTCGRVEDRSRYFVSFLDEFENVAYRDCLGSAQAAISIHDGDGADLSLKYVGGGRDG